MTLLGLLVALFASVKAWDTECGRSPHEIERHIVGGQPALQGQWPWQASIRRNTGSHFCGGVIMNANFVLCAAHCTVNRTPQTTRVVVGEHETTEIDNMYRVEHQVSAIYNHPQYGSASRFDADISLLRVSEPIVISEFVGPACRPDGDNLYVGDQSVVSGWGTLSPGGSTPTILMWVEMPIPSNEDCDRALSSDRITPGMICAGRIPENERDSCQGDSGGPMVVKNADDRWMVVGLVSWGYGCASGTPGVYTRVGHYLDWIDNTIAFSELSGL